MNFVSLFGLITLLLIAWAMSYHRKKVQFRPIVLGIGLQFVLALTILNSDIKSFVGMSALVFVLVIFALRDQEQIKDRPFANHALHGFGALVLGAVLYFLGATLLLWILIIVLIGLFVNGLYLKKTTLQPWLGAVFMTTGVAYFIAAEKSGKMLFDVFKEQVEYVLSLSDFGAEFMFGNLAMEEYFFNSNDFFPGFGFLFAFKVLPTIIFFGGLMSVLYYFGIIQVVIAAMGRFMRWTLGTSGAESLSCSANIFVGQTEAPLLVKPFLQGMTKSELLTIMVGGFATIAGGVLAGYINMGVDAGHLIAASVMSAPAALVMGKIIFPETEHSETAGDVELPEIKVGDNVLEAATNGISDGFKLALNVGAMLVGFIALIALLDVILSFLDGLIDGHLLGLFRGEVEKVPYAITGSSPVVSEYPGIFPGSLQTFFGTVLRPLAWLMGVPWEDAAAVGNLLGVKLSLNEFVAFGSLGSYINNGVIGERAAVVATYALCGFANFSSIGIQLGGIGALAQDRRSDLAKVVLKAMFGGAFASWTTACIAGIFL